MRHAITPAFVTLALLVAPACAPTPTPEEGYSSLHGDSGISGRPYDEIVNSLKAFANKHPGLAEMQEYGTTVRGRKMAVMKIVDKSVQAPAKRPAILISEGIHGNEFLNITDRLPGEFLDKSEAGSGFKKFLAKGGVVYLVPVINPDGYTARQRENARGQDLNRNFTIKAAGNTGFTEPETKGISDYMKREQAAMGFSLEMSMEYHCCIGGLIHPWAHTRNPLEPVAKKRHTDVGDVVKSIFGYRYGTVREIVGYEAIGGSDDYYYETYGRRAFTFEGAERTESSKLPKHVEFWDKMFGMVADEAGGPPPQATGELWLAAGDAAAGVMLYGSAPAAYETLSLCVGTAAECTGTGGRTIAATLHKTVGDRKIFKAAEAVAIATDQGVTVKAAKAGGVEPLKRHTLVKKN